MLKKQLNNSILSLKNNLLSAIAVFLVAIPLCLGVANASGAPLISGLIAGIIGGIIVGFFSPSSLSVSGPAAGLTIVVFESIKSFGNFNSFLLALLFAGLIQIILGIVRAGGIADYLPSSVIDGMLVSIGLILIIKEFPLLIGMVDNTKNTGSAIIGIFSLIILFSWEKLSYQKLKIIPSSLLVIAVSIFINSIIYKSYFPQLILDKNLLINLPLHYKISSFFTTPNFSEVFNIHIYKTAIVIALIASVESLLSLEAMEKIDPFKRRVSANKELIAQGIGNFLSGLLGGLPITSVIVRGSVNVSAGATNKLSAIIHGFLLLFAVLFIPLIINFIPLSSLAAILIFTGFHLAAPNIFIKNYLRGKEKFLPFIFTIILILFTDLLQGVIGGIIVCTLYTLKKYYDKKVYKIIDKDNQKIILLERNITFFHKKQIIDVLNNLPENINLTIDGSQNEYIHYDVIEIIQDFQFNAIYKNIKLTVIGLKNKFN
ncbi:MAG: SulP family inorganic anion transporter [Candidatus Sericytochromatia bacterium]|nr:SulP family inorganic anion transporter [Candidatus Sericytochromatia bacterium]